MSEKYCIFLRGVNVNGVKMKMVDLKCAFAEMSFANAKTILATGNVIIASSENDMATMKALIEKGLGGYFKYDANIFIRSKDGLEAVISASKGIGAPPDCHLYYLICDDPIVTAELYNLFNSLPHQNNEMFYIMDSGAFWVVPVGETLESPFGSKALGDKKYKAKLTSRNINTIEKILQAMQAG